MAYERIVLGGYRLASLLEYIFSDKVSEDDFTAMEDAIRPLQMMMKEDDLSFAVNVRENDEAVEQMWLESTQVQLQYSSNKSPPKKDYEYASMSKSYVSLTSSKGMMNSDDLESESEESCSTS